jgi:acetyl-CoA synthetase
VVFAGFSSHALSSRIQDAKCRIVITATESKRGGRSVPLKKYVDEALKDCPSVEVSNLDGALLTIKHVLLMHHVGDHPVHVTEGRDLWLHEEMARQRPYCPPEWMDAEDPLFMLYTSGSTGFATQSDALTSTGSPKGVVHTQAGYLLYTTLTHRYIFDYREGDVYACVADVGWITYVHRREMTSYPI